MKCPICETEIRNTSSSEIKCVRCGFDDIRTEFINDEERIFWQTYVVKPCKYAYRLNYTLQNEVAMLRREIKKRNLTSDGNGTTNTTPPAQPQAQMQDGWNYDDPISHPNSAECSYYDKKSRVYNIKAEMTGGTNAKITFVVQKTQDSKGKNSAEQLGVRYRVKDADGIIVLNEKKYVSGLKIGDASRETIELKGVTPGRYSIDFVDC